MVNCKVLSAPRNPSVIFTDYTPKQNKKVVNLISLKQITTWHSPTWSSSLQGISFFSFKVFTSTLVTWPIWWLHGLTLCSRQLQAAQWVQSSKEVSMASVSSHLPFVLSPRDPQKPTKKRERKRQDKSCIRWEAGGTKRRSDVYSYTKGPARPQCLSCTLMSRWESVQRAMPCRG